MISLPKSAYPEPLLFVQGSIGQPEMGEKARSERERGKRGSQTSKGASLVPKG